MNDQVSPEFPDNDHTPIEFSYTDQEQAGDGSQTNSCFLCGETNIEGAKVCRHCDIDLTGDPRDTLAQRQKEVMQSIEKLENGFILNERDVYEETGIEWCAERVILASRNLILIGLLLAPFVVGVPVLVAGAVIQHASIKARNKAHTAGQMISQIDVDERRRLTREYGHLTTIDRAIEKLGPA